MPEESNKKKTGLRWKPKKPHSLKFVDDSMVVSKINMDSAVVDTQPQQKPVKTKHDMQSQNIFRRIVRKAESRGMVVNNAKTKVLCVSDSLNYTARSYITDDNGNDILSTGNLKVLGFHLDSKPTCHAHVRALQLRMRDTTVGA